MTVAATLDLPSHQQQLLNHIHRGDVTSGSRAVQVLADSGADPGDLIALGRDRLVRIHHFDIDVDLDAVEADPGVLATYDIRVLPTDAGIRWVVDNPANSLLTYLAGSATGKAALLELKQNTNCEEGDGNILDKLRGACLIEVRDEAGRDVRRIRLHIAYSDRWLISITRTGRRRVGQS